LQAALREKKATGSNLKQEIDDLASSGLLPPVICEWATQLRLLGNESAHPQADQEPARPEDAEDIVQFLDFLLEYLYGLPHRIEGYRTRRLDP
jgi:hypothetical protein